MKKTIIAITSLVAIASSIVIILLACHGKPQFRAVCRFAYSSRSIQLSEHGEIIVPPDFPIDIEVPAVFSSPGIFATNVLCCYRNQPQKENIDCEKISRLVSQAHIERIHKYAPVMELSIVADDENTARELVESYLDAIQEFDEHEIVSRLSQAEHEIMRNIEKQQQRVSRLASRISEMESVGVQGVDKIHAEYDGAKKALIELNEDIEKIKAEYKLKPHNVQRLGEVEIRILE